MKPNERELMRQRAGWQYDGRTRPPFAVTPGPGQESVWDYPRPPRLGPDPRLVEVRIGDVVVASTRRALRLIETAGAPTFYLPPEDVQKGLLEPAAGASFCEWKGEARYWSVVVPGQGGGRRVERAAWSYPDPHPEYAGLRDHLAFFADRLECFVDGERARPQPGGFYGGWVTSELVGPIKGEPGSQGW